MAMMALCRENVEHQNRMCEEGGIEPLVRLIKSTKSSEKVLLTAIRTLGTLCIGTSTNPLVWLYNCIGISPSLQAFGDQGLAEGGKKKATSLFYPSYSLYKTVEST